MSAGVKSMLGASECCTSYLAAFTGEPSGAQRTAISQNLAPRETGMAVAAAASFVFPAMQ
ncbi:hypothetical protein LY78DRAFT_663076 [Colletotrichum sublineola]|nr:hypothetical protein LY78DRAFT_663076 [Colletotrichum sublineola]